MTQAAEGQHEKQVFSQFDVFFWANVRPEASGLPFIVWISEKGCARDDVRVKISPGPRVREFTASLSVRPEVTLVAGDMTAADFALAKAWVELNRDVIIRFWEGDILYTDEALAALQRRAPINAAPLSPCTSAAFRLCSGHDRLHA